jgi:hypothetical protein
MILGNPAPPGRLLCGPSWLMVLILVGGCAPRVGGVSGTVTYQGKPLETGTIIFYDAANNAPSSPINKDGTYSIPKVAAGKVKIAVLMPLAIPFKGMDMPAVGGKQPTESIKVPTLPPRFADPEQSGLSYEVTAGNNMHDVKLD